MLSGREGEGPSFELFVGSIAIASWKLEGLNGVETAD